MTLEEERFIEHAPVLFILKFLVIQGGLCIVLIAFASYLSYFLSYLTGITGIFDTIFRTVTTCTFSFILLDKYIRPAGIWVIRREVRKRRKKRRQIKHAT